MKSFREAESVDRQFGVQMKNTQATPTRQRERGKSCVYYRPKTRNKMALESLSNSCRFHLKRFIPN